MAFPQSPKDCRSHGWYQSSNPCIYESYSTTLDHPHHWCCTSHRSVPGVAERCRCPFHPQRSSFSMSSIASNFAWIAKQDPHNILAILVYQSSKCLCEVASFGRTNLLICLITVIRSCINKICYLGRLFPNKILSKNIITIPLNNLLLIAKLSPNSSLAGLS